MKRRVLRMVIACSVLLAMATPLVLVKHARYAFVSQDVIAAQGKLLHPSSWPATYRRPTASVGCRVWQGPA